jgi:hypothetical protein
LWSHTEASAPISSRVRTREMTPEAAASIRVVAPAPGNTKQKMKAQNLVTIVASHVKCESIAKRNTS